MTARSVLDPRAPKRWPGSTVVCAATGPSLDDEQLQVIRQQQQAGRWRVIAISDNYRRAPWADVVYACDLAWWKVHHAQVAKEAPEAEYWACCNVAADRFGLHRVRSANRPGLGTWQVHTGGNSGYSAINLAFLFGATRILLVGYDMQATGGKKHWFGDHPARLVQVQLFDEWLHRFKALGTDLRAAGIQVINCTRQTALREFPLSTIEDEAHHHAEDVLRA